MIQILKKIFIENDFSISSPAFLGTHEGFMAISNKQARSSYFLILFGSEETDFTELTERSQHFYAEIKRLPEGYDRKMDKNFTLLVCVKRAAHTTDEVLNRSIFDFEEDPYLFRKLVLPYTDQEVTDLRENHISDGVTEGLYELINNKEKFFEFKKYLVESTAYNLTSRLFIKLPFLSYIGVHEELGILNSVIRERLEALDLNSIRESSLELVQRMEHIPEDKNTEKDTLFNNWLGVIKSE